MSAIVRGARRASLRRIRPCRRSQWHPARYTLALLVPLLGACRRQEAENGGSTATHAAPILALRSDSLPQIERFTSWMSHLGGARDTVALHPVGGAVDVAGTLELPEPGFPISASVKWKREGAATATIDLTITATDCCKPAAPNPATYAYKATLRAAPATSYRLRVHHAIARAFDVDFDTARVRTTLIADTVIQLP